MVSTQDMIKDRGLTGEVRDSVLSEMANTSAPFKTNQTRGKLKMGQIILGSSIMGRDKCFGLRTKSITRLIHSLTR